MTLYPFNFSVIKESGVTVPYSKVDEDPWMLITKYEAETYCKAADKRLPTSKEWLLAAQGTPDIHCNQPSDNSQSCNIWNFGDNPSIPKGSSLVLNKFNGGAVRTGTAELCKSTVGAYDMIGNAWEWVSEIVIGDTEQGFRFPINAENKFISWPKQGNITKYNNDYGIPAETNASLLTKNFNGDYTYTFADNNCSGKNIDGYGCNKKTAKIRGIMRGGSAVNGGAAGIYRVDIDDSPSHSFNLLGFRCAKDSS